jgi:hypothetical protein
MCDAQHIGSIDGDAPERAYQDIPPSVARLVWRRDGGRCRVPGCRSSRGLELHHLVHRSDGGSHDAANIALICSSCHQAHHEGTLTITGTAEHLEVRRSDAETCAHVGAFVEPSSDANTCAHRDAPNKLDVAVRRAQTKDALIGLGWKPSIAGAAVTAASAAVGPEATLEQLIFEALRRCSRPIVTAERIPRAP